MGAAAFDMFDEWEAVVGYDRPVVEARRAVARGDERRAHMHALLCDETNASREEADELIRRAAARGFRAVVDALAPLRGVCRPDPRGL